MFVLRPLFIRLALFVFVSLAVVPRAAAVAKEPVAVVSASGPREVTLVLPVRGNRYLADPCFDASGRLLTISEEPTGSRLERRATLTGPVRRLLPLPHAFDATFGPGCRSIAELHGGGVGTDVWLRRPGRPAKRVVRTQAYFEIRPRVAFSQDGRRLTVLDRRAGRLIVLSATSGSVLRTVTLRGSDDGELSPQAMSPDGRLVTFGDASGVRVLQVRSGTVRTALGGFGDPAFAPDGSRIAATSGERLAIFAPDGTGPQFQDTGAANVADPMWAPDSSALAVSFSPSVTSTTEALGVIQPGQPGVDRRYAKTDFALNPARWSQDGQRLVVNGFSLLGD